MGVLKPELIMKSVVPVVMAGILGIYGMIVAVIIVQRSYYHPIQLAPTTQINQLTPIWLQDSAAASAPWYLHVNVRQPDWQLELWAMQECEQMLSKTRSSWE